VQRARALAARYVEQYPSGRRIKSVIRFGHLE